MSHEEDGRALMRRIHAGEASHSSAVLTLAMLSGSSFGFRTQVVSNDVLERISAAILERDLSSIAEKQPCLWDIRHLKPGITFVQVTLLPGVT